MEKPLSSFGTDKSCKDGLKYACKSCDHNRYKLRCEYVVPVVSKDAIKKCSQCRQKKSLMEFYRRRGNKDGREASCKSCHSNYARIWRNRNKEATKYHAQTYYKKNRLKYLEKSKERHLRKTFGLSKLQYAQLLVKQNGRCAICDVPADECVRLLSVDHDHNTGEIRGLLCGSCNTAIGLLKDDPVILASALQYLASKKVQIRKLDN
jgi:hypothetical protein